MHRLKYTIMLHYKMTSVKVYRLCTVLFIVHISYYAGIILITFNNWYPLYSNLCWHNRWVFICGSSRSSSHTAAMLCYACIIMWPTNYNRLYYHCLIPRDSNYNFNCHNHHLSSYTKWCRENIGHHWLMRFNPLLLHQGCF